LLRGEWIPGRIAGARARVAVPPDKLRLFLGASMFGPPVTAGGIAGIQDPRPGWISEFRRPRAPVFSSFSTRFFCSPCSLYLGLYLLYLALVVLVSFFFTLSSPLDRQFLRASSGRLLLLLLLLLLRSKSCFFGSLKLKLGKRGVFFCLMI